MKLNDITMPRLVVEVCGDKLESVLKTDVAAVGAWPLGPAASYGARGRQGGGVRTEAVRWRGDVGRRHDVQRQEGGGAHSRRSSTFLRGSCSSRIPCRPGPMAAYALLFGRRT